MRTKVQIVRGEHYRTIQDKQAMPNGTLYIKNCNEECFSSEFFMHVLFYRCSKGLAKRKLFDEQTFYHLATLLGAVGSCLVLFDKI